MICLGEGTWEENVKLERLRVSGAEGRGCADRAEGICTARVRVQGQAKEEITEAEIAHNGMDPFGYGLLLTGPAGATISRSSIKAQLRRGS